MCRLHAVIVLCFCRWQGLANRSMRIQDLYVGTFPWFIRNIPIRCWGGGDVYREGEVCISLIVSPSQLCLVKRIGKIIRGPDSYVQSYARAHVPAYPHTPTHIRMRTHTGSLSKRTEHSRGDIPAVCVHDVAKHL